AVNDELGEVERGIAAAMELLAPGGRLVVVAFHSLEDRIVKQAMAAASGRGGASRHDPAALSGHAKPAFHLLTSRALRPQEAECGANPRARSARLRSIQRMVKERAA
ncbi:MAG: 16S rRNA (cytosine(1402)-N(4))-methyltransferase, partial [Acetobacteraceae bacterium]